MKYPDPQEIADSTWQPAPLRRWQLKFFASLCLIGFLVGLMLGKALRPEQGAVPQLLEVSTAENGLQLCFSALPQAAVLEGKAVDGAFVMLFAVAPVESKRGQLKARGGEQLSWQLSARDGGMQLGIVGVKAVRGHWSAVSGSACIQVQAALL